MIPALLTALLDGALQRLPHEPNLHDKRALGAQIHDDALSLAELGGPVRDERTTGDKRTLIGQVQDQLRRLDPLGDEAEYATLTLLLRRQERHVLDLPPDRFLPPAATTLPARDAHVEIGRERPGPHADLNHALIVAEVAATTALETGSLDLMALIDERTNATATLEAEVMWGSEPVDLSAYERLLALPLDDRVEELLGKGARSDEDPAL